MILLRQLRHYWIVLVHELDHLDVSEDKSDQKHCTREDSSKHGVDIVLTSDIEARNFLSERVDSSEYVINVPGWSFTISVKAWHKKYY